MTEFLTTDGQLVSTGELTGLTAAAEEVIAARPELVWDLVADVTRVGGWSPECTRAAWLTGPGRPRPGARFTGHNRLPNGFEYDVTCVVTEACGKEVVGSFIGIGVIHRPGAGLPAWPAAVRVSAPATRLPGPPAPPRSGAVGRRSLLPPDGSHPRSGVPPARRNPGAGSGDRR
jgi:hypothetical protein